MYKEFRDFIMRGNVLDLAIGIIIGSAFGRIVTSLVNDLIMPPIGLLLGKVDFTSLYINLSGGNYATRADAQKAGAATLNYGLFINTIIDFLIVAIVIFFIIRAVNHFKKPVPKEASKTKDCPYCFTAVPSKATRCPACTSDLKGR
jgi:large conductance mechanosensitive channel